MRSILPATILSLFLWYGLLQGAIVLSNHLVPSFIPNAKHTVHEAVVKAKRRVLAQSF